MLLAASGLIFVIACSNVANLILARSVRREGELAIRAALGASAAALRRTLLAESLILCGAGAILAVLMARPMVGVLSRYAARYSVRALDVTVDSTMLWVGAGLALVAAVLLAYVPKLPTADGANSVSLAAGGTRITTGTNRRLRLFAVTQIAASFVLLAGAGMLLTTLVALQRTRTGFVTENVLAVNVPVVDFTRKPEEIVGLYRETVRRVSALPGVQTVAVGSTVPWRDGGFFAAQFSVEGYNKAAGEDDPRARFRTVTPNYFATLGVPIVAGRDFNEGDRRGEERVVIVSQSLAERMFPGQDAVNRRFQWTDPVIKFIDVSGDMRRIVGVAADVDDENIIPRATDDRLSPARAGIRRRTAVPQGQRRSLCAGAGGDPDHPRAVGRSAGRAGRHPRRRAGRGAVPQSAERAGLRRLRLGGAAHRRGRRGRRAGLLGERPHPRVRRPPGHRIGAATPADGRAARGRGDRRRRHRRRRASAASCWRASSAATSTASAFPTCCRRCWPPCC